MGEAEWQGPPSTPESEPAPAERRAPHRLTTAAVVVTTTLILLLGVSTAVAAMTGGFEPAASRIPQLAPGHTFHAGGMDISVRDAQLIDGLRASGAYPNEGERLLIVRAEVTNVDDVPRATVLQGSLEDVRIQGLDGHPSVSRADDGTISPWLQPHVPAPILLTWIVPADRLHAGQDLVVALQREVKQDSTFAAEPFWQGEGVGATVPVTVVDAGKGDR